MQWPQRWVQNYLQTFALVQAGKIDRPLLDCSGNVVGVVSAKVDAVNMMLAADDLPRNVNFAVDSAIVSLSSTPTASTMRPVCR